MKTLPNHLFDERNAIQIILLKLKKIKQKKGYFVEKLTKKKNKTGTKKQNTRKEKERKKTKQKNKHLFHKRRYSTKT